MRLTRKGGVVSPGHMTPQITDSQISKECNHLNCLSKTHLIPDHTPHLLAVEFPQPFHSSLLVAIQVEREEEKGGGRRGGGGGREEWTMGRGKGRL